MEQLGAASGTEGVPTCLQLALEFIWAHDSEGYSGGMSDSGREHAEQAAACRSLKVPHRRHSMPPLPTRISSTPARTPMSRPAIVDRTKPTGGSTAPNAEIPMPNGTSDIIERTTAKKIKAPRSPHAVTVIQHVGTTNVSPIILGLASWITSTRIDSHTGSSAQSSLWRPSDAPPQERLEFLG